MLETTEAPMTVTHLPQTTEPRNPGMPLDMERVMRSRANRSAIERRASSLPGRRSLKKDFQAAWLARAISCIDLTTLAGDDTPGRVARLCAKAKQPVREDLLEALGLEGLTTGAVCVYHDMIAPAVSALQGSGIPVAAVSTGFPAGLSPFPILSPELHPLLASSNSEIHPTFARSRTRERRP